MSRSGYSDDCDVWDLICWRGRVASAMRGRRGQKFLKELMDTLDAMPAKRLVPYEFEKEGDVCALGAVARVRGIDISNLDPDDDSGAEFLADKFNIASPMSKEIIFMNDEYFSGSPEDRWTKMRTWIAEQILPEIEI